MLTKAVVKVSMLSIFMGPWAPGCLTKKNCSVSMRYGLLAFYFVIAGRDPGLSGLIAAVEQDRRKGIALAI